MPEDLHLETMQFTLPGVYANYSSENTALSSAGTNVELLLDTANLKIVKSVDYIDLQGWTTLRDNTMYPTDVNLQRGFTYGFSFSGSTVNGQDYLYDLVFILPREITAAEQSQLMNLNYPSFVNINTLSPGTSSIDKQHVLWGQWNLVSSDTVIAPLAVPRDGNTFGTGEPTLANRLWVYRFTHIINVNSINCTIPPINGMIEGAFGKEPKMEYMERLRRTFVLASDLE